MKKKWFTVSENPIGMFGRGRSFHVEPGRVAGHYHVKATSPKSALRKVYG